MLKRKNTTLTLFFLCNLMFLLELIFPIDMLFSFIPILAFTQPWRFVTSIFLHANIAHLFFNMFALIMFGNYLELKIGSKRYLTIFFLAGIVGNLAYWLTDPESLIPAVGASGAIYGVIGALAVIQPELMVYVGYVPMPIIVAAILWALISIVGMFTPSNIAHQAHLAGLVVGAIYGYRIRKEERKKAFIFL